VPFTAHHVRFYFRGLQSLKRDNRCNDPGPKTLLGVDHGDSGMYAVATPRQQFETTSGDCLIVCLWKNAPATSHNRIGRKDECAGSSLHCPTSFFLRQALRKIHRLLTPQGRFIDLGRTDFIRNKTDLK
jgi:hypothetical protein